MDVIASPKISSEYCFPVCERHGEQRFNLSFFRGFYRMPKHWRGEIMCTQRNCYADATHWLYVELDEAVLGKSKEASR